jgi:hypothetical protein
MKLSCLIVLDYDKPFGHNDFIGKIPTPQLVVVNPVSARCHMIYILDQEYDVTDDLYAQVSEQMGVMIGAEKVNPFSFRSPFFITGTRLRHEAFRKGIREADYHYVIHQSAWSFNLIEAVWSVVAFKRWGAVRKSRFPRGEKVDVAIAASTGRVTYSGPKAPKSMALAA